MRILFLLALVVIGYSTPFWFFIVCGALYVILWQGYELMVLGVLIDAQFAEPSIPLMYLYTLSSTALMLFALAIKPHLRFYHDAE
jgi:hypothetical protein